ncbi:hemolysin-III-like protein 1 [Elsinoe fawcettii]|nr:hemolysin-III-like protein 1 [Elsinoe fawcettii]
MSRRGIATRKRTPIPWQDAANAIRIEHNRQSVRLLRFDELPQWLQDNALVRTGYRPVSGSVRTSLRSLTYIHNETFNIWSHLIPSFATLLAITTGIDSVFTSRYPEASRWDRTLLVYYLISVTACFLLSATFHTLINHSQEYYKRYLKIDYCGIMILILADFITGEYLGFYCEPNLRNFYWTLIVLCTTLTAVFVLHPSYQSHVYRNRRVGALTALGMSAFMPIAHSLMLHDAAEFAARSGLYWYLLEGSVVLIAVGFFVTKFPECWRPGKHDIWGSSHQWSHVLTVGTVVVHLTGLFKAYEVNYQLKRC